MKRVASAAERDICVVVLGGWGNGDGVEGGLGDDEVEIFGVR